jgi:hypothetical protein
MLKRGVMLIGPNGVILSTHPTGRESTITVAASDSSPQSKAQADYVCNGIDDQVEIQAAIDALSASGGKVVLSEGTFNLSATITIDGDDIIFEGQQGTILSGGDSITPLYIGSATTPRYRNFIRNMTITGGNPYLIHILGLNISALEGLYLLGSAATTHLIYAESMAQVVIRKCHLYKFTDYGIYYGGGNCNSVENCYINQADPSPTKGVGIYIDHTTATKYRICGCVFETGYTAIHLKGYTHEVDSCYFEGNDNIDIILDSSYSRVANCTANGADVAQNFIRVGINQDGNKIENIRASGYVDRAINFLGYNNRDIGFSELYPVANLGILPDERKRQLLEALGPLVRDADIIFPFAIGQGDRVMDISGNGQLGYLYNAPTWGTIAETGWGKLTLDGVDQYIRVPKSGWTNNVNADGDRTWIVVVSPNFLESEDATRTIFFWEEPVNTHYVYLIKYGASLSNQVRFGIKSAVAIYADALLGFDQNEILILVATFNSATGVAKFYYDGKLVAQVSGGESPTTTAGKLTLGIYYNETDYRWLGDFHFFALLPRVLNDNEVREVSKQLARLMGVVLENSGTAIFSGDGLATSFSFAHGLATTPTVVNLEAKSADAAGDKYWTADATNITVTFAAAPAAGTDNVVIGWEAKVR